MEFRFTNREQFMEKLENILESGMSPDNMKIVMPNPDHEIEHLVEHYKSPSKLKYFTLVGGLTGCLTGYAFTAWTAIDWQLVTGGKPFFSWPAYTVIAFVLTILFGALASFAGLLILGKLPRFSKMLNPENYANEYVIIIEDED